MPASALSSTQRLILLCALALGVILMHHVGAPGAMPGTVEAVAGHTEPSPAAVVQTTETSPHHACGQCGAHVMTHVCLAVLDETAPTVPALLAFVGVAADGAVSPRGSPLPGRPPALHGRAVLTALCVLRV